jgi:hypothetical protein
VIQHEEDSEKSPRLTNRRLGHPKIKVDGWANRGAMFFKSLQSRRVDPFNLI